jgi:hypothetical protein
MPVVRPSQISFSESPMGITAITLTNSGKSDPLSNVFGFMVLSFIFPWPRINQPLFGFHSQATFFADFSIFLSRASKSAFL